jgi:hypothetical protein
MPSSYTMLNVSFYTSEIQIVPSGFTILGS